VRIGLSERLLVTLFRRVTVMQNGAMVEIATVGDEGVLRINALFGVDLFGTEAMMQVPDTNAEVLPVAIFKRELERRGPLHECVPRYAQGFLMQVMPSTACMALHPVQQRCCRWLLMTHDRVRRDDFHLSHEFLAMMLGSTRPTVTLVAGTLQEGRTHQIRSRSDHDSRPCGPRRGLVRVLPHRQGPL